MSRPALCLVAAALLPSCVQGPDYQNPGAVTGDRWKQSAASSSAAMPDEWWKLFRDSALNRLVSQSLAANQDLAAARARVETARALVGAAKAGWWPQGNASAGLNSARNSAGNLQLPPGFAPDLTTTSLRAALDVSYELDLWGRVRRQTESAQASLNAAADRVAAQRLSLATEVARTYFLWRSLGMQATVLRETVKWRQDAVEMQTSRQQAGLIAGSDVARAQAELELARADLEFVKRQRGSAEHALAALCGEPPSQFRASEGGAMRVPEIRPGIPSTLLLRRPDLRALEQTIVAANAEIGVAQAAMLPSFKLLASGGLQTLDAGSFLNWENRVLSIGPSVTSTVFDGGRLKANVRAAISRRDEAVASWRQAVIVALREVEDALLDLKSLAAHDNILAAAESAATEANRLALERYDKKITAYFEVVDTSRTLLSIRLSRALIAGQRPAAAAALARALGGGWE
jgi:multidrug efflux system outer membrane protein